MNINDLYALVDSRKEFGSSGALTVFAHGAVATSTTVIAASSGLIGATLYNDTDGLIYLLLGGGTVSSSSFSVKLSVGALYELPYKFQGSVTAIKGTATTGNLYVTIIN